MRRVNGRILATALAMSVAMSGVAIPLRTDVVSASVKVASSYDLFKYHDYTEKGSDANFIIDVTDLVKSTDTILNKTSNVQVVSNVTDNISIAIPSYRVFRFTGWYWHDKEHDRYVLKSTYNTFIRSAGDDEEYYPIYVYDKDLEKDVTNTDYKKGDLSYCTDTHLDTSKLYPKSSNEVLEDKIKAGRMIKEEKTNDGVVLSALDEYGDFRFYQWYRVDGKEVEDYSSEPEITIDPSEKGVSYYATYKYDETHEAVSYGKYDVYSSTDECYVGGYAIIQREDGSIEPVFNAGNYSIYKSISTLEDCEYSDSLTFEAKKELDDYKGYKFAGWSTKPDGSDLMRYDGSAYDSFYTKTLDLTKNQRQILFPVYDTTGIEVNNTLQIGSRTASTEDVYLVKDGTQVRGTYPYASKIEIYNAFNIDGALYVGTIPLETCDGAKGMSLHGKSGTGYAIKYMGRWYFYTIKSGVSEPEVVTDSFAKYIDEETSDLDDIGDVVTPISATMGDPSLDGDGDNDNDDIVDDDDDEDDTPETVKLNDVTGNTSETPAQYSKSLIFTFTGTQEKVILDDTFTFYDNAFSVTDDGVHHIKVYNTDGTVTEYSFVLDTTAPEVKGLENGYIDIADEITFSDATSGIASATLDGVAVESGFTVETEGKHTLVLKDNVGNTKTVSFVVDNSFPVIDGVVHGKTYTSAVTLKISDEYSGIKYANLNNKKITTSTYKVTSSGNYKLTVEDNTGHATQIYFKVRIKATGVKGVKSGKTYKKNVKFKLTGKKSEIKSVKLNKKNISIAKAKKGYTVNKNGSYKLKIQDKSGHKATIAFKIKKKK